MLRTVKTILVTFLLTVIGSSCMSHQAGLDSSGAEKRIVGELLESPGKKLWTGVYAGFLEHPETNMHLPFEISLIRGNKNKDLEKNKQIAVIAIATAFRGDFSSHEYASYLESKMTFDSATGKLLAPSKSAIRKMEVSGDLLSGEIQFGRKNAKFLTSRVDPENRSKELSSPRPAAMLTGTYKSECMGQTLYLDVKGTQLSYRASRPKFMTVPVVASLYGYGRRGCAGASGLCVKERNMRGEFDFTGEQLKFSSRHLLNQCQMSAQSILICGKCAFDRKPVQASLKSHGVETDWDYMEGLGEKTSKVNVSTFHKGVLVNSHTGHSQWMEFKPAKSSGGRSFVVNHFWTSDLNPSFKTSYVFKSRKPNIADDKTLLLTGRHDGIFKIDTFYENGLVGHWYSKVSGYMGKVILYKNTAQTAEIPVTGYFQPVYKSPSGALKIGMKPAYGKNDFDFFPNKFFGVGMKKDEKSLYVGGVFDRRSGYLALLGKDSSLSTGSADAFGVHLLQDANLVDLERKRLKIVGRYRTDLGITTASRLKKIQKNQSVSQAKKLSTSTLEKSQKFEDLLKDLDSKKLEKEGSQLF